MAAPVIDKEHGKLVRGRRKERKPEAPPPVSAKIGKLLLELHAALVRVDRCRRDLWNLGYPSERWQEIVNSVEPEARFAARRRILDAIRAHLESAGEPMGRDRLANELSALRAGPRAQVQAVIAVWVKKRALKQFPGNKVGLPGGSKRVRKPSFVKSLGERKT